MLLVLELFCGTGQLGIEGPLAGEPAPAPLRIPSPASCAITGKNLTPLGQEAEMLLCDWQSAESSSFKRAGPLLTSSLPTRRQLRLYEAPLSARLTAAGCFLPTACWCWSTIKP